MNYTVLRESVVFRSAPGTKLRLLVDEPVAFETLTPMRRAVGADLGGDHAQRAVLLEWSG